MGDSSSSRWLRPVLILVLANVLLTLSSPFSRGVSGESARRRVISAESLPALADRLPPGTRATALRDVVVRDAQALEQTRAALRAEHARLRVLGAEMTAVLDARQTAWISSNRDRISLERFEKPYWARLRERLQP